MFETSQKIDEENKLEKILTKSDRQGIALISFALQEKTVGQMMKDLTVKFTKDEALTISGALQNKQDEFIRLLQDKLTTDQIKREKKEHSNGARPYVGQILFSACGYDCTIVSFYQVLKVTKCFVTVKQIRKQVTKNCDGYGQQTMERPILNSFYENSKPIKRHIKQYGSNTSYISISNYKIAKPWDGKDVYRDTLD